MSTVLTPDNGFQFPPAPAPAILNREEWNGVLAWLVARIVALQGRDLDYQAVVDQLIGQALETVSASLTQEIEAGRAEFEAVRDAFEELQSGGFEASRIKATLAGYGAITDVQAALSALAAAYPKASGTDLGKFFAVGANGVATPTTIDLYAAALMNRTAATQNTTITKAMKGGLVDCSAALTLSFAAAETLGAGFFVFTRNAGTGDIPIDPNGSETIDGLTSFISYPGEARLIQCDGTALRSIVVSPGTKVFTITDNFVWPPGINGAVVEPEAGGGGGGRGNGGSFGGGGGGGGGRDPKVVTALPAGTITLATVGSGSLGATVNSTQGSAGGASSFGNLAFAQGGIGGQPQAGNSGGAAGPLQVTGAVGQGASGSYGAPANQGADKGGGGGGNGQASTNGAPGGQSINGGGGGGGGGGYNNYAGGSGGAAGPQGGPSGGAGNNSAGGNGASGSNGAAGFGGTGGAGGGGSVSGAGGRGGDGGFPSGGGGGGGAGNSGTSGNGGNGGAGRIVVRMF